MGEEGNFFLQLEYGREEMFHNESLDVWSI